MFHYGFWKYSRSRPSGVGQSRPTGIGRYRQSGRSRSSGCRCYPEKQEIRRMWQTACSTMASVGAALPARQHALGKRQVQDQRGVAKVVFLGLQEKTCRTGNTHSTGSRQTGRSRAILQEGIRKERKEACIPDFCETTCSRPGYGNSQLPTKEQVNPDLRKAVVPGNGVPRKQSRFVPKNQVAAGPNSRSRPTVDGNPLLPGQQQLLGKKSPHTNRKKLCQANRC